MRGKSTGERLNGATYRAIVQHAINGDSIGQVAKAVNVDWSTAKAVIERESRPIQERKRELADACMRIAQHATERIEDNLHTAPFQSLPTIVGIMTDKVVALTSDPIQSQNLHIHLNAVDLIGSFNQMLSKIENSGSLASDVPLRTADAHGVNPNSLQEQEHTSCNVIPTCSEKRVQYKHESIKKTPGTQSQLDDSPPKQQ